MAMTLELSHQPMHPIFISLCAGGSRHERLVRKWCYAASSMPECHRPPLRHLYVANTSQMGQIVGCR